jgi:serine/threonine protein kinase
MEKVTAELLLQRAYDVGLIDTRQMESVWSELGARNATMEDVKSLLIRKGLMTNFEIDRLLEGQRTGYFYGDYRVQYIVGTGTFARVYRAVNKKDSTDAAVKVLRKRYSDDSEKTEQFLREARMVMTLRHPNIVPIYQVDSDRGRPFMVMDFVEGRNLRDFVKIRQKLTLNESLRVIADVLSGLDYALAKAGITHRDLKLSNVLIASTGRARLVDFGLAAADNKLSDEAILNAPNPRSIDYAGLERTTGVRKDDKRSDIYFAGCMLYHMLTGHSPLFETKERMKRLNASRYRDIKPIAEWEPSLPHHVVAVVQKAMEMNPERRYQTPGEMLADVKTCIQRIEAGDIRPVDPTELAALKAGKTAQRSVHAGDKNAPGAEGGGRTVMVVETNAEVQDQLRDGLKKLGYRVLVIGSPERAMQRFDYQKSGADCVIFSTVELGWDGLKAFNEFAGGEYTSEIPCILLVGEKQRLSPEDVKSASHRITLPMPLQFSQLRASLKELLHR